MIENYSDFIYGFLLGGLLGTALFIFIAFFLIPWTMEGKE